MKARSNVRLSTRSRDWIAWTTALILLTTSACSTFHLSDDQTNERSPAGKNSNHLSTLPPGDSCFDASAISKKDAELIHSMRSKLLALPSPYIMNRNGHSKSRSHSLTVREYNQRVLQIVSVYGPDLSPSAKILLLADHHRRRLAEFAETMKDFPEVAKAYKAFDKEVANFSRRMNRSLWNPARLWDALNSHEGAFMNAMDKIESALRKAIRESGMDPEEKHHLQSDINHYLVGVHKNAGERINSYMRLLNVVHGVDEFVGATTATGALFILGFLTLGMTDVAAGATGTIAVAVAGEAAKDIGLFIGATLARTAGVALLAGGTMGAIEETKQIGKAFIGDGKTSDVNFPSDGIFCSMARKTLEVSKGLDGMESQVLAKAWDGAKVGAAFGAGYSFSPALAMAAGFALGSWTLVDTGLGECRDAIRDWLSATRDSPDDETAIVRLKEAQRKAWDCGVDEVAVVASLLLGFRTSKQVPIDQTGHTMGFLALVRQAMTDILNPREAYARAQTAIKSKIEARAKREEAEGPQSLAQRDFYEIESARAALENFKGSARTSVYYFFQSKLHPLTSSGRAVIFDEYYLETFRSTVVRMLNDLAKALSRPINQGIVDFSGDQVPLADQQALIQELVQFLEAQAGDSGISPGRAWFLRQMRAEWPKINERTTMATLISRLIGRYIPERSSPTLDAASRSLQNAMTSLNDTLKSDAFTKSVNAVKQFFAKRSKIMIFSQTVHIGIWVLIMKHYSGVYRHKEHTKLAKNPEFQSWLAEYDLLNNELERMIPSKAVAASESVEATAARIQRLAASLHSILPSNSAGREELEDDSYELLARTSKAAFESSHLRYLEAIKTGDAGRIEEARAQDWGILSDRLIMETLLSNKMAQRESLDRIIEDLKTSDDVQSFLTQFLAHSRQIREALEAAAEVDLSVNGPG